MLLLFLSLDWQSAILMRYHWNATLCALIVAIAKKKDNNNQKTHRNV